MQKIAVIGALAAGCGLAGADVFVEVHFQGETPNGATEGDLVIFDDTALSVSMWADEPGVDIGDFMLRLDGTSQQGVLGSGGVFSFSSLGVVDSGGNFGLSDPGMISGSGTSIEGVFGSSFLITTFEIPVGPENAVVLYEGFSGAALTGGAGVLPEIDLLFSFGDETDVHTFGVFQTPSPGGLAVLLGAGVFGSRRRR